MSILYYITGVRIQKVLVELLEIRQSSLYLAGCMDYRLISTSRLQKHAIRTSRTGSNFQKQTPDLKNSSVASATRILKYTSNLEVLLIKHYEL